MIRRLLLLNGLAILMIPIQHASAYGLQAMFGWASPPEVSGGPAALATLPLAYYVTMIIRQLAAFAVPAFLFISGYFVAFMARGKESRVTLSSVVPRIKVLLPPFIVWTIGRNLLLGRLPRNIDDILNPYHFVPLLIQFYLLAPLLVPFAKKRPRLLLFAAAALHLGVQALRYGGNLGLDLPGLESALSMIPRWIVVGQQPFWFPFGLVFGLYGQRHVRRLVQARWLLLAGAVVFAIAANTEYLLADTINPDEWVGPSFSGFSRNFYILFVILCGLSFDVAPGATVKAINHIGTRSLGIYMANIPAIYMIAVLMYHFTPALLRIQVVYQPVLAITGLIVPLLLMWLTRQIVTLRPAYRYLFG